MAPDFSSDTASWGKNAELQPADNLEDVIFLFNPQRALDDEYLRFYVDRGSPARQIMATLLRVNDLVRGQPIKLLFTGHSGSGKSTELNRLCQDLEQRCFVVKVPAAGRWCWCSTTQTNPTLCALASFSSATLRPRARSSPR